MSKRAQNLGLHYGNGIGYVPFEEDRFLKQLLIKETFEKSNWRKWITKWHTIQRHRGNKIEVTVVESARRRFFSMFDLNADQIVLDSEKTFSAFGIHPNQILKKDAYKQFILPEGSSGEKAYIGSGGVRRIEKGVFPIGAWTTYTEEYQLFSTAETIFDIMRDYGEISSLLIDSYYRDVMFNTAGYRINMLQYENGYNSIHSPILGEVLKGLTSRMKKYGAREVSKIMTASPNYKSEPIYARFVTKIPYDAETEIRRNPGFIPIEKYGTNVKLLKDEIGILGNTRVVTDMDMPIREQDGRIVVDMLVYGESPIDGLRVDGKSGVELIHVARERDDKADKLKRFGVIGFKSFLGSLEMHPERMAVVSVYLDRLGIDDLIELDKRCNDSCIIDCKEDGCLLEDQNDC